MEHTKKTLLIFIAAVLLLLVILPLGKSKDKQDTLIQEVMTVPSLQIEREGDVGKELRRTQLPPSQRLFQIQLEDVPKYTMLTLDPEESKRKLEANREAEGRGLIGEVSPFNRTINQRGRWFESQSGESVWLFTIVLGGTGGVRLHLTNFNLPSGAEVYIYSPQAPETFEGPYTSKGPFGNRDFWTATIFDEKVTIEYFYPHRDLNQVSELPFAISEVAYLYSTSSQNLPQCLGERPCYIDAGCYDQYLPHRRTTGLLTAVEPPRVFGCTGTLVNNTKSDLTPYFLTANHCVSSGKIAQTVEVYWFDETPCGGPSPNVESLPRTVGAKYLAGESCVFGTDFALLLLIEDPPEGVVYSGWTTRDLDRGDTVVSVHHANGCPLKISFGNVQLFDFPCTGALLGNPSCITNPADYWNIQWHIGSIWQISSGSGLFLDDTSNVLLVGQLSNGSQSSLGCMDDACYGKFNRYFEEIRQYLAPSCGTVAPSRNWQTVTNTLTLRRSDEYCFSANTGEQFDFSTCNTDGSGGNADFDTVLEIYDESENLLISSDNRCPGTELSAIQNWAAPGSGPFILRIHGLGGATGNYTLAYRLSPGLTVTSPNGGENWPAGTTRTIDWSYTEDPGRYVKIELLKRGSADHVIDSRAWIGRRGSGSYSWGIPSTQTPGTDYTIRVTSTTDSTYTDASDGDFTISSPPPSATTDPASNITSNSATLHGTVNPNGLSTTVYFQWGTSTSYGNTTGSHPVGSGTNNVSVSANLPGLSDDTTYHYRIVGSNSVGTDYGANETFTTEPSTPTNNPPNGPTSLSQWKSDGVTPIPLGETTNESTVVLKGGVSDPDGDTVRLKLEVRLTPQAFTGTPNCTSGFIYSGGTASATCSGLSDGNYHWRGRTKDSEGAVSGWISAGNNADGQTDFVVSTIICNPPGSFSLSSPSNGASLSATTSVTLSWGVSSEANSYDVYLGTSASPPFLTSKSGTSHTVSVVSAQTYYWKVIARVTCNPSLTSTAGSWSFTVQQPPSPCTYSISPTSQSFGSGGGSGSVSVTVGSGCNWTATSNAGWITIISGSSGSGNGTVNYSVATNTSTSSRTGTISIEDKTFTVNQAGASPPIISARIDIYYPSNQNNPVQVNVGQSTIIGVTFTNTGNVAWNFVAGATIWNCNGSQVANFEETLSTALPPGGQTTASWSHNVSQPGDYWLQFGVWKAKPFTPQNLLDTEPSPSERVIIGRASVAPISWEFNTDGNSEGWTFTNITTAIVSGGFLGMDPAGFDPYISGPTISANAASYRQIQLRMASNALDGFGEIFFKTQVENFYSEDKKVLFSVTNCSLCGNAPYYTYTINMGSHPKWVCTITGIRIDPASSGQGGTSMDAIGFDYIRLTQ